MRYYSFLHPITYIKERKSYIITTYFILFSLNAVTKYISIDNCSFILHCVHVSVSVLNCLC